MCNLKRLLAHAFLTIIMSRTGGIHLSLLEAVLATHSPPTQILKYFVVKKTAAICIYRWLK